MSFWKLTFPILACLPVVKPRRDTEASSRRSAETVCLMSLTADRVRHESQHFARLFIDDNSGRGCRQDAGDAAVEWVNVTILANCFPRNPRLSAGEHKCINFSLTNVWYFIMRDDSHLAAGQCPGRVELLLDGGLPDRGAGDHRPVGRQRRPSAGPFRDGR